jgi:hypothetical protein
MFNLNKMFMVLMVFFLHLNEFFFILAGSKLLFGVKNNQ